MKIDWEKRREEIEKEFNWAREANSGDYEENKSIVASEIISQEQSLIQQLEADKAELLETLKEICTAYDEDRPVRIGEYFQLIQKMEK